MHFTCKTSPSSVAGEQTTSLESCAKVFQVKSKTQLSLIRTLHALAPWSLRRASLRLCCGVLQWCFSIIVDASVQTRTLREIRVSDFRPKCLDETTTVAGELIPVVNLPGSACDLAFVLRITWCCLLMPRHSCRLSRRLSCHLSRQLSCFAHGCFPVEPAHCLQAASDLIYIYSDFPKGQGAETTELYRCIM